MMRQHLRASRAFTLTEIVIVLGIIGLIIGAIWVAVATVYSHMRVQKFTQEIWVIVNNVRAAYPTGIISNIPITLTDPGVYAGWFPADMVQTAITCDDGSNPCPLSPWGKGVTIHADDSSLGTVQSAPNDLEIETNMPASDCPAFMTAMLLQGRSLNLNYIYSDFAGGVAVTPTTPLNSGVVTSCQNNIVLQFGF